MAETSITQNDKPQETLSDLKQWNAYGHPVTAWFCRLFEANAWFPALIVIDGIPGKRYFFIEYIWEWTPYHVWALLRTSYDNYNAVIVQIDDAAARGYPIRDTHAFTGLGIFQQKSAEFVAFRMKVCDQERQSPSRQYGRY